MFIILLYLFHISVVHKKVLKVNTGVGIILIMSFNRYDDDDDDEDDDDDDDENCQFIFLYTATQKNVFLLISDTL